MLGCGSRHTTSVQWIDQVDETEIDMKPNQIVAQSILQPALYDRMFRAIASFVD